MIRKSDTQDFENKVSWSSAIGGAIFWICITVMFIATIKGCNHTL